MAEVHLIGTLVGASDFPSPNLCCKYKFLAGDDWKVVEGETSGQTQVDLPLVSLSDIFIASESEDSLVVNDICT